MISYECCALTRDKFQSDKANINDCGRWKKGESLISNFNPTS